jgi:hypothetical protein
MLEIGWKADIMGIVRDSWEIEQKRKSVEVGGSRCEKFPQCLTSVSPFTPNLGKPITKM